MPSMLLIPKSVRIRNQRLNFLHYVLMTATLVLYIAWWVYYRKFNKEVDIQHDIDLVTFPEIAAAGLNETFQSRIREQFCLNTQGLSDDVMKVTYRAITCSPVCENMTMLSTTQCISTFDFFKVENRDSILFPTLIYKTEYDQERSGSVDAYMVPYESHLAASMSYNFNVETKPFWDLFFDKQTYRADSNVDILTVVMQGGHLKMVFTPDMELRLSLHDIFAWSGTEGILDEPNLLVQWKTPTHALSARFTGVEFNILVTCRNRRHRKNIPMLRQLPSHFHSWQHICQLEVIRSRRGWVYSEEKIEDPSLMSSPAAMKRFFGIRLRFRTAGSFEYVYWGKFIDAIIQLLVLCRLPMQIVKFVATTMLGSLSLIYSRVLQEPFGIREQVGGLATRLMANSATYLDLTDQQDSSGRWGISISRMRERLSASLSHQKDLDGDEINAMTSFCYKSVVDWQLAKRSEAQQIADMFAKDAHLSHTKDDAAPEIIMEEEYGEAMTNNEALGFHDVVKLFDRDRRLTFMERLFSPAYLLELHKRPKVEKGKPEHPMEQSGLQRPACTEDFSEAAVRFSTASSLGVSRQSSMRMSSLEIQKDEVRQNSMRIEALEEKDTTLEEQVLQLSRKYWELAQSLSEQEVVLREMLQSNTGNPKKCMAENLQLEMIGEQLKKEIDASLAEREAVFGQQFEKLKKQVGEECSQMTSRASELHYEMEVLDMQYKALDLRLSSLCIDDLMTCIYCNKATDLTQQGTPMSLQDTSSESTKKGAIYVNDAGSLTSHNANMAQTPASQAKFCTSAEMGLSVNRGKDKQEKGERQEKADLDASQHSSKGVPGQMVPQRMRWLM